MQQPDSVLSLRAELLRANREIMALKNGNLSLMEQVEQQEHQLKDKDGVIKKEIKKRRARLRAYIDCMAELTECQAKARSMEASMHQEPPQPETSWSREVEVEKEKEKEKEKEIQALKEQVEQLQHQLNDKDGVIRKETTKRRACLRAYIDCMAELTDCQAKSKSMEASLQQEPPQPETSWSREVEVDEENQAPKGPVNLLEVGQRRLLVKLINKDQLITCETKKGELPTSAARACALQTKRSIGRVGAGGEAGGDDSNYGTELQKGGGRDELEQREEVEKEKKAYQCSKKRAMIRRLY